MHCSSIDRLQLVDRSTRFTRVFKVTQKASAANGNIGVLWSMVEKELGVEFPTTWQEATVRQKATEMATEGDVSMLVQVSLFRCHDLKLCC